MADALKNFREIKGYTLVNLDKLQRAVFGQIGAEGKNVGGVGEEASPAQVLAEYDRLGGLIRKGKVKVKTGSFYDFEGRKAFAKPKVVLEFRDLRGKKVELDEAATVPAEIQAAEKIREEDEAEATKSRAKSAKKKAEAKKSKKAKPADSEEEELDGEEDEADEESEEAEESEEEAGEETE